MLLRFQQSPFLDFRRWTALALLFAFLLTTVQRGDLAFAAANVPAVYKPALLDSLDDLVLPEEFGSVEDRFDPHPNSAKVILIQDAHAIPDAQRSIRHLLLYLQKKYGIRRIAVEGASEALDPLMFTSFPDKAALLKVLRELMSRGELSGSVAAALMGVNDHIKQPEYFGIEDWRLYEEALELYLKAMAVQEAVIGRLDEELLSLEKEKRGSYSDELFAIDRAEILFRENKKELLEYLNDLAKIKQPEVQSDIALFLAESNRRDARDEDLKNEIHRVVEDFRSHLPRISPGSRRSFNQQWQAYQTGELETAQFALALKELGKSDGLELILPQRLDSGVMIQKRLRDVEGTQFFRSLENYTREVKESLFVSASERALDARSRQILLRKKLALLELSRKEWQEVRQDDLFVKEGFESSLAFYDNAEQRDAVFYDKISRAAKPGESLVMIAGGFHTEGLVERFKKAGLAYAVVMPRIQELPEQTGYRAHMQGEVSWKSYFRIDDTRLNLYEPFVRYVRDQLLQNAKEGAVLKEWRDQLIRDLWREGRIEEAGQYTRFLDEAIVPKADHLQSGIEKLDPFFDGLRRLDREGRFQASHIHQLLQAGLSPSGKNVPSGPDSASVLVRNATLALRAMSDLRGEVDDQTDVLAEQLTFLRQRSEVRSTAEEDSLPLPVSLKKAVEAKRALIESGQADAIDELLYRQFKNSYVRVTLRHQSDLDHLITNVSIAQGGIQKSEGPLLKIIREGGVIMIDYAGSDPKLVDGLNKLLDTQNASYRGVAVHPNTRIIGVVDRPIYEFDTPFKRRYGSKHRLEELPYADPLADEARYRTPAGIQGIVAELDDSPEVEAVLLGRTRFDFQGRLSIDPNPPLVRAIKEARPLIVRGASLYRNPELSRFMRQLVLRREYTFNGVTLPLPDDFKIYLDEGDYSQRPPDKFFVTEFQPYEKVYAVNSMTQDMLFEKTFSNRAGLLAQAKGLLEEDGPPLSLLITETLADWVWHKILKSKRRIDIKVSQGVAVPKVYQELLKESLDEDGLEILEESLPWQALPSAVLQGDDSGLLRERIQRQFKGQEVVHFFAGPQSSVSDLLESLEFTSGPSKAGQPAEFSAKALLEALQRGAVVVLEGLEDNPALQRSLESLLIENPYFIKNGEYYSLNETGARFFVLARNPLDVTAKRVEPMVEATDDELKSILQNEFKDRFEASENFEKIKQLEKIFNDLPAPRQTGLYPEEFRLDLEKLRQIYRFGDLARAFDRFVISKYEGVPEVAAFMRIMVRLVLDEGKDAKPSVSEPMVQQALDRTVGLITKDENFWQFAEALSTDLLQDAIEIDSGFYGQKTFSVFEKIGLALVNDAMQKQDAVLAAFYRTTFDLPDSADLDQSPSLITEPLRSERDTRDAELQQIADDLALAKAAFFQGAPGTGKSYAVAEVARKLQFDTKTQVIRLTTGRDASYGEVTAQQGMDSDGKTVLMDGAISQWAKLPEGGILQVDEANLPKGRHFWDFLKGLYAPEPFVDIGGQRIFLTKRHLIIFTGNENTLEGRHDQAFLDQYAMTVPFRPFETVFLREEALSRLQELERVTQTSKRDLPSLSQLIVDLHAVFDKVHRGRDFSIRDVLELAERSFYETGRTWTVEDIAVLAWDEYSGFFDEEEKSALAVSLQIQFGINIAASYGRKTEETAKRLSGSTAFKTRGIVLTKSIAESLSAAETFLTLTRKHAATAQKQLEKQQAPYKSVGKKGMLFEGHAGRGKDAALIALFEERGIAYEHISASLDTEELEAAIRRAMTRGTVLLVSELNLLDSAYLEGKLNDVLTTDAAEGFAFFATINSADYSGREKLSTALQNRLLYHRLEDYDAAELAEIAEGLRGSLSASQANQLVSLHLWTVQNIDQRGRRPSAAELLQTLALMRDNGVAFDAAVQRVYGLSYLEGILGEVRLPNAKELETGIEIKKQEEDARYRRVLELIAEWIIPPQKGPVTIDTTDENDPNAAGYYNEAQNLIHIEPRLFVTGEWLATLLHEASHGLFTRLKVFPGSLSKIILDDFEDLRHTAAFDAVYPYAAIGRSGPELERLAYAALNPQAGVMDLSSWMNEKGDDRLTPRVLFRIALMTYGKKLVTREQLTELARRWKENFPNELTLERALSVLDEVDTIAAALPAALNESEIKIKQFRALSAMRAIEAEYKKIGQVKKDITGNAARRPVPVMNPDLSVVTHSSALGQAVARTLAAPESSVRRPGAGWLNRARSFAGVFFTDVWKRYGRLSVITISIAASLAVLFFIGRAYLPVPDKVSQNPAAPSGMSDPMLPRVDAEPVLPTVPEMPPFDLWVSQPWYVYAGIVLFSFAVVFYAVTRFSPKFAASLRSLTGPGVHRGEGESNEGSSAAAVSEPGEIAFESVKRLFPRRVELQQASSNIHKDLAPILREFSTTKLQSDRVYGPTGTFDIARYAAHAPPNSLFRKSGGVPEQVLMPLKVGVSMGRLGHDHFEELTHEGLTEFLHLYEEMGGKVILVYGAEPQPYTVVTGSSVFINAETLAAKIEGFYVYGVLQKKWQRLTAEEERFAQSRAEGFELAQSVGLQRSLRLYPSYKEGLERKDKPRWQLTLDSEEEPWQWEQAETLRTRVTDLIVKDPEVSDASFAASWTNLQALDLSETGIQDLTPLWGLPIAAIKVPASVSEEQLEQLYLRHPLKKFTLQTEGRYYTPNRGSFALQLEFRRFEPILIENAGRFSWSWGEGFIKIDSSGEKFNLDLSSESLAKSFFKLFNGVRSKVFFKFLRNSQFLKSVIVGDDFWEIARGAGFTFEDDFLPMLQETPSLEELKIQLDFNAETSWLGRIRSLKKLTLDFAGPSLVTDGGKMKPVDLSLIAAKHRGTLESLTMLGAEKFMNWEALGELRSLRKLSLVSPYYSSDQDAGNLDLKVLTFLPELESLNLGGPYTLNPQELVSLTSLKDLQLHRLSSEIPDLTPLQNLRSLDIYGSEIIPTLDVIAGLVRLETFKVHSDKVTTLEPLSRLTKLKTLSLGLKQVKDLTPLAGLSELQWVRLKIAEAGGINALRGKNLRYLMVDAMTSRKTVDPMRDIFGPLLTAHPNPEQMELKIIQGSGSRWAIDMNTGRDLAHDKLMRALRVIHPEAALHAALKRIVSERLAEPQDSYASVILRDGTKRHIDLAGAVTQFIEIHRSEVRQAAALPEAAGITKEDFRSAGKDLSAYLYGKVTAGMLESLANKIETLYQRRGKVTVEDFIAMLREVTEQQLRTLQEKRRGETVPVKDGLRMKDAFLFVDRVQQRLNTDFQGFNGGYTVASTLRKEDGKTKVMNLIRAIAQLRDAGSIRHALVVANAEQRKMLAEEQNRIGLPADAVLPLSRMSEPGIVQLKFQSGQTRLPHAVRESSVLSGQYPFLVPIELLEDTQGLSTADLEILEAVSVFIQLAAAAVIARESESAPEDVRGKLKQMLLIQGAEIDEKVVNSVFKTRDGKFLLSQGGLLGVMRTIQAQYDALMAAQKSA